MIFRQAPNCYTALTTPTMFRPLGLNFVYSPDMLCEPPVMPFPKILLKKRLWLGVVGALLFIGVYVYAQFIKVSVYHAYDVM